jgi:hypothetical protein
MKASARSDSPKAAPLTEPQLLTLRHLRWGWISLIVFLSLGIALETLHGVKASFYLDVSNHTRRLMWTLAHAHGTLLALVQIAFAVTVQYVPVWEAKQRGFASVCLIGSSVLIPSGFFLGGVVVHAGDPGVGIILVPLGGLLLLVSGILTARAVWGHRIGSR